MPIGRRLVAPRLNDRLELDDRATLRRQGDFGGATMEQLAHDQVGGVSRRVEARGEIDGLAMHVAPLVAGGLGHTCQAPESGLDSEPSPVSPNVPSSRVTVKTAAPPRAADLSRAGPASRIIRNAFLTNASSPGARAQHDQSAEPLVRHETGRIVRAGSPGQEGLASAGPRRPPRSKVYRPT